MDAIVEQLLEELLGPLLGLNKHQDRRLQTLLYQIPTQTGSLLEKNKNQQKFYFINTAQNSTKKLRRYRYLP